MDPATILEAALALPEEERIRLVERLLETFGPESDGLDDAGFAAELRRRSDEIDQDRAGLVPWSELKEEPF